VATLLSFALAPTGFASGVLVGGIIVTTNFHLLYRSLRQALTPPHQTNVQVVLGKYYIRFLVSAVVIFIFIAEQLVNPLGLVIGLSVVVASIIIAALNEIRLIIF
jgi:hypothetical protein